MRPGATTEEAHTLEQVSLRYASRREDQRLARREVCCRVDTLLVGRRAHLLGACALVVVPEPQPRLDLATEAT
jgi:hypothetical protein